MERKRIELPVGPGVSNCLEMPNHRRIVDLWVSIPPVDIVGAVLTDSMAREVIKLTGAELDSRVIGARLYSRLPMTTEHAPNGFQASLLGRMYWLLELTPFAPARMIAIFDMMMDV